EQAQGESSGASAQTEKREPAWRRRLELPFRVDQTRANAKFTNGILRIELPRAESTLARRIAIEG
ncbi:MAG: Hsp20 family protein, partial [Kiritimatiellae bacterium]|nr:Hsp20 family protein [Kiritimatiellia bacterium]